MTSITSSTFQLTTPQDRTLHGILDLPADQPQPWPVVVICHGFKGFMEWSFFPHLAQLLAERGFATVRFNLSGAGMAPGDEKVTDLAAFRDNTYSRELEDLLAVLDALSEDGDLHDERFNMDRLGLFGHSRGGGAALLAASHRDWAHQVSALVTWAAIAYVDRFPQEEKEMWHIRGTSSIINSRTGQELPLGLGLLEDIDTNRLKLDLEAAAGRREAPWLLVHGTDDESVPKSEAERLAAAATGDYEVLYIDGAGHTFGATHPFSGPTPHLTEAMNATQSWFRECLTGEGRKAAEEGAEEAADDGGDGDEAEAGDSEE